MNDNKEFNELLIEILKQIHVRLDRLDAKVDTKADKEDVNALRVSVEKDINIVKEDVNALRVSVEKDINIVKEDVNALRVSVEKDINIVKEDVNSLGQRLDRIEAGIGALRWVIGAEVAIIGVILAFLKAC